MKRYLPLFFLLLFSISVEAQELAGPERALPGNLVLFEITPPQEASWHIVAHSSGTVSYQIDSGLSKLYFASPEQGWYTVVAGIVADGFPELLVKTFFNGDEDDNRLPGPIRLIPSSSLETWIKTQLPLLVQSRNLISETRLVAECFAAIVQRIEAENIRTVQNAQSQLQISITGSLALASPTAVTDWMPFLEQLSSRLEAEPGDQNADIDEVKKKLQKIAHALQSFELPGADRAVLPAIENPAGRIQGTQNRSFRTFITR